MSGMLASTAAAVGIIDKAVGIAKKLADDDGELDKATLKLELANLMSELASVKMEVITTQALLFEAEQKNKQLEEQLKDKQNFHFRDGVYWKEGDEIAFCPKCYEGAGKKLHMRSQFTEAEPDWGIRARSYWCCYHCHFEQNKSG
ncbi:TPA: hypothetical protein ACGSTA_002003 [Enterobacter cloacae]|uniref:Uncharacterized protein n=1 Tax=Pseudenterobacter timonensis TaxID=1755099 RepID=A0AAE4DPE9_9ENTR|nr:MULTISPECIES: hypothetical protein [Enterobacteriaceae]MCK7421324.1 hypothetical protein [Enterobacter asburiae]MDR9891493.1 hypothetical protein [Pseudenterobacter timonensis]UER83031.1 hypothetical protein LMJ45_18865 [Enterobacter cloacae]GKL50930.1 hypothetical protein NUKP61_13180 [Klebsiella variicola]